MIRIELARGGPSQIGGDIKVETPRRWYRLAAYFGEAPGSHMGFWRTRTGFSGGLQGWNYRIGTLHRCLTVLAHTHPARTNRVTP